MTEPVPIPADEVDDPVAINDHLLLERERRKMRGEAAIRDLHPET